MSKAVVYQWAVSGLDCGSCAGKVRGAVERLPGVSGVSISPMSARLTLTLDETQTPRGAVEAAVRALGYGIVSASAASAPVEPEAEHWYHSGKGRLVMGTGGLLLAAWAVTLVAPAPVAHGAFVLACLIGLAPVAWQAMASLRAGMPFTIELLMTLAALGALVIGAAEEAALVVFLFAVGEVLEGVAANKARDGIRALARLIPKTAWLEDGGSLREVPAETLTPGQVILVRPGDRIPADGLILEGLSEVDDSPVTGESVPVRKGPGAAVFAGSINTAAALHIQVTKAAEDNTIARIIRLVEEAEASRAPTERFIDRFSRYYMPAVVGVAVLVAIVPPLGFGQAWETWVYRALALLLIGCPCALVISVPAAMASALSAGTRWGLLMKGGAVIEAAARVRRVAFDKTGTLTHGRPIVTDVLPLGILDTSAVLALAAGVESASSHPLARAILAHAQQVGATLPPARAAQAIVGRGAEAEVDGQRTWVASPRLAEDHGALDDPARQQVARLEEAGKTVAVLFREGCGLGLIALRDEPRAEAVEALSQLRALGVEAVMLTGDNPRTAAAIAGGLGIPFHAAMLPEDKLQAVRDMAANGGVMMIGDGINDAPALKQASIGIAMGSGTDVALETADAALLRNKITDVAATLRLSRATMAIVHQNVALALGLKGVFLVTSTLGLTGLWMAVLADSGATVLVTLNALRLLAFKAQR